MSATSYKPGSGVMLRAKCIVAGKSVCRYVIHEVPLVAVVGDPAVGKTSLMHVFHGEGTPSKGYSMVRKH